MFTKRNAACLPWVPHGPHLMPPSSGVDTLLSYEWVSDCSVFAEHLITTDVSTTKAEIQHGSECADRILTGEPVIPVVATELL